jgi:hypothetical protein
MKPYLRDRTLSWKAKGILAFLLKYSEENITQQHLFFYSTEKKHGVLTGLRELLNKKYIYRLRSENHNKWGYFISETPKEKEDVLEIIKGTGQYIFTMVVK